MLKRILLSVLSICTVSISEVLIPIDKGEFQILYSPLYKGAVKVSYQLDKRVNVENIKKRPSFYKEVTLPIVIATIPEDLTNTGMDRGHLAPDAAFDYNEEVLNKTYSMANIVPQYPNVNRKVWASIEELERYTAVQFGKIEVENYVFYGSEYLKKLPLEEILSDSSRNIKDINKYSNKYIRDAKNLEEKKIRVPTGFLKKIKAKEFMECYYVENKKEIEIKSVKDFLVECKDYKY